MSTLKLRDNLTWAGTLDPDTHISDVIVPMEFGTTYNSYILKGSEKTAVIETSKIKFKDGYISDFPDVKIDYIIDNHTEPDHAGAVADLIKKFPEAEVVCSSTAAGFLKEQLNSDFHAITVGDGDTLSLGNLTLEFYIVPNLHWPDTMFTYVREENTLYTCDVFGAHYCPPSGDIRRSELKGEDLDDYMRTMQDYFNIIIGPFKNPYMSDALLKIKDLEIDLICPGHGPVLDDGIDWVMGKYETWCKKGEENNPKKVVIPYVNAYGFTGTLAGEIAAGISDAAGAEIVMYDMVEEKDTAKVVDEINQADGVLFGTPTILGDALKPIWDLTTSIFPPLMEGKTAAAFGAYGWSGEGVPNIEERLKQLRFDVLPGLRVRFKPSENDLIDAYELGYQFGIRLITPKKEKTGTVAGAQMMKCAVCGAVFDASVEKCPVCGVGPEKFVPVAAEETTFSKDTDETFAIIGGGPAAFAAAGAVRDRNKTAVIKIITNEEFVPYNRPMLTKALLSDFGEEGLAIEKKTWYDEKNIEVISGTEVTAIDTEGKVLKTDKGDIAYDKLIYTPGAFCFVPPIKGSEKDHVKTVRNIKDTVEIKKLLKEKNVDEVVCIGGGVMGLEGAWELVLGGYDVTVLETAPGLLPKQLDDEASALVEEICNDNGVKIVTGAKITEITDDAVLLEDGRSYPAGLVIMSTGMRPYTALAEEAGIAVDKWVSVDTKMQTNIEGIYAAGDCAAVNGAPQAFYDQAMATGKVAGANAAGDDISYDMLGARMVISAMNTEIFALGANGKDPDKVYRTVEFKDKKRKTYEKYYFYNDILEGVILIGDTSKMLEMTDNIADHKTFKEIF